MLSQRRDLLEQPLDFYNNNKSARLHESARAFLDDLGRQISVLSGDDREHLFLFQRISVVVAIQRFNAVLLHDGFPSEDHLDYFFHFKLLCIFLKFFPTLILQGFKKVIIIIIIIIIIIRQFIRCRNMSESLQGHRTTSNANTWIANSYYILYDKENMFL